MPNDKFAPSEQAKQICLEVVEAWKEEHGVTTNLEEPTYQLASRVRTWISPRSVLGGVQDIMAPQLGADLESALKMEQLGNHLGQRLMDEGLLLASPKRSASLG